MDRQGAKERAHVDETLLQERKVLRLVQRHLAKVGEVRARQRHVGAVRVAALHVPHAQPRSTRHNVPGQVDRPLLNVREGMQERDAAAL